jgi:anti-sigma28 factor (negative regulator of flagellin synthesis)
MFIMLNLRFLSNFKGLRGGKLTLKDLPNDKELNKLLEEIIKEQEMRKERIEELKRLIREKNYNVPVEEIVEKMLEKFRKKG